MFEAAKASRDPGLTEIVPYWIYEGDSKIQRFVPALPLSRDRARAEALKKAVAAYRLAFGQPRQDDLLAYLTGEIGEDKLTELARDIAVDLRPVTTE